jgi:hypothetical protein
MFAAVYSVGTRRWMTAMLLASTILAMFLVQIWLFWSRAEICCADVREALGCARGSSSAGQCRGFGGLCAELGELHFPFAAAHAQAVGGMPGAQPRPVRLPQCLAFPDGSGRDTFLAGLISAACALPFAAFVSALFSLSVATDAQQTHGATRLLTWPLRFRVLLGRADWGLATARTPALRRRLGSWWSTSLATDAVVAAADACIAVLAWLRRGGGPPPPPAPRLPASGLDLDAAKAFDALTLAYRYAGFVVLYTTWGVFVWLIFVYGKLIYDLLGPSVEEEFARAWAVGVGLNQLNDLQAFVVTTAQVLLAATVLDALFLLPNVRWLETQVDYASVQASSLRGASGSWARRWVTYLRHMKSVQA